MPETEKPDVVVSKAEPASGDPEVQRLLNESVAASKDVAEAIRAQIAAAAVSSADDSPKFDMDAAQKTHGKNLADALDKADKLCVDGKYGEGMATVLAAAANAPQAPQGDPNDHPAVKALTRTVMASVRNEHSEMFDKFGPEVEEEIARLKGDAKFDHSAISGAVSAVRARHSEELIKAQAEELAKKMFESSVTSPPQNIPVARLGESKDTELHELTVEQREMAASLRVPYDEMAFQVKGNESRVNRDGTVDILPVLDQYGTIEPGSF